MKYSKISLAIFPVLFGFFYFLPGLVNLVLVSVTILGLYFFLRTQNYNKKEFFLDFLKTYYMLFFLILSYYILPFYIFYFNALLFFGAEIYSQSKIKKYWQIGKIRISAKQLVFWLFSVATMILVLWLFAQNFSLKRKILSTLFIPLVYSYFFFKTFDEFKTSKIYPFLFIFVGQFLFLLCKLTDFRVHWYGSAILAGVFVVFVVTTLMYLLDMIYRKEFFVVFLIQYFLFVFGGHKVYSFFVLNFTFFYLLRRILKELSYSISVPDFRRVLQEKQNLKIYFVPFTLIFLSLFVKKALFYPFFYIMILASFSFALLFYMDDISSFFLKKFSFQYKESFVIKKIVIPNLIVLLYLFFAFLLTKINIMGLLFAWVSANLSLGFYYGYNQINKKFFFHGEWAILPLSYVSGLVAIIGFYLMK